MGYSQEFNASQHAEHVTTIQLAPMGRAIPNMVSSNTDIRTKGDMTVAVVGRDSEEAIPENIVFTKSTLRDVEHMRRMGKNQRLVRNFRLISVIAFAAIAASAWEFGLFLITPGLIDGGRPVLVWGLLWSFIGFAPIYLNLGSMASDLSRAPTSGSQYHWVSEFAPERLQMPLSYVTGWTETIGWQSGNALGVFLAGTLIQSLILINDPTYDFPNWQGTLLVFGAVGIAYCGNVFGSRVLHHWQSTVFVIQVLAYLAFLIPVWVNAPKASSKQVWSEFTNAGGWSQLPLAVMIGQVTGIYTQLGSDTTAHMSEEVHDAARTVPKAMITVYLINFTLLFPLFVTVCYHIPNIQDALEDPTTYPAIYVLRQAMPRAWMTVLLVVMILIILCANIAFLAAVTRDMFAFARDNGLPFSEWIAKVDDKRNIPHHAVLVTSGISILLAIIYIGSPVAFYAITSLITVALLQCYCLSIGCILWRRIVHPETLPPAEFPLGKFGIPINAAAVLFALWAFFWAFWPQKTPITAAGFNWASVIFVGVLVVAAIHFVVKARHVYTGPVALVEGRKRHASSD